MPHRSLHHGAGNLALSCSSVEPIGRRPFAQAERAQVQERYATAAEARSGRLFRSYADDPRSFRGRYVAADLFKEQFADYRASRDNRYLFNTPLHNTAAVLASEWLRRTIEGPSISGKRENALALAGAVADAAALHEVPDRRRRWGEYSGLVDQLFR